MEKDRYSLRVGQILHGFCGGTFGRDSYSDKRVEAIGADWLVAREDGGAVVLATGEESLDFLAAHCTEPDPSSTGPGTPFGV